MNRFSLIYSIFQYEIQLCVLIFSCMDAVPFQTLSALLNFLFSNKAFDPSSPILTIQFSKKSLKKFAFEMEKRHYTQKSYNYIFPLKSGKLFYCFKFHPLTLNTKSRQQIKSDYANPGSSCWIERKLKAFLPSELPSPMLEVQNCSFVHQQIVSLIYRGSPQFGICRI